MDTPKLHIHSNAKRTMQLEIQLEGIFLRFRILTKTFNKAGNLCACKLFIGDENEYRRMCEWLRVKFFLSVTFSEKPTLMFAHPVLRCHFILSLLGDCELLRETLPMGRPFCVSSGFQWKCQERSDLWFTVRHTIASVNDSDVSAK